MFELLQSYVATATASDFFAGGLALGALGLAAATLRGWVRLLTGLVARRIRVSVTLDNRSPAYRHFCLWLEESGVLAHVRQVRMTDGEWARGTSGFAPGPGRHWFTHGGHLCCLDRQLDTKARVGPGHAQRPMETLVVTVLLGRVETVTDWIARGAAIARAQDRFGPGLWVLNVDWWDKRADVARRGLDTVVTTDGRVDEVARDMRRFYRSRDWYAERGVPWRRGYLLHGPPGTGKSSLIRALASELDLDIATLDLGRATLTDDALQEAMGTAPRGALIAMEDIDAVFTARQGGERRSGVSFSGLLNAIDGVGAQEGRALVMTTNHPERLDPALIRPGRADVHVELGLVGGPTAGRLFARFHPDRPGLAGRFATALGAARFSPAELQGWLLQHRDDPERAAAAEGLLAAPVPVAAE
ncbi:AAA family ATPase [Jannaschia marina]|uniref:AAA family ATPase n=1 Tax=Jannaschia marina TaxID=2741674 RepID=UPI0015C6C9ED|nr:AAA family ATPase [Jannaschia marina]